MTNDNKVYALPNIDQDALKGAVEAMVRAMPAYEGYVKQLARIRKHAYDAYIVEGFTPEQATILCQNMIL